MFVRLSVCPSVLRSICPSVCLSVSLSVCLSADLFACSSVCLYERKDLKFKFTPSIREIQYFAIINFIDAITTINYLLTNRIVLSFCYIK